MKIRILGFILLLSTSAGAQSESFSVLRHHFSGVEGVTSVHVGGFVLRTILWLSDDEDISEGIGDIRSIRLMNIPQQELTTRNLKLSGFKKVLAEDGFDQVVSVKENGEWVTLYLQPGKKENRYFMLIEEKSEITAIELTGYLDPEKLMKQNCRETIQL